MTYGYEYWGQECLRRGPSAVLFNSRQSKFPRGRDFWVEPTCRTVDFLVDRGVLLYTSIGMHTWELVAARCSYIGGRQIIVVPNRPRDYQETSEHLSREFNLNLNTAGFVIPSKEPQGKGKKTWMGRDIAIAAAASTIYPVAVNMKGNLATLMQQYQRKVNARFAIDYMNNARKRPSYTGLTIRDVFLSGEYIIHFTRSRPGPWPDEQSLDFYRAVWESGDEYCHSANATLDHIVKTGLIKAGHDKIRGGFSVVSFAAMNSGNSGAMFRYRSRLVNPGFEPYGIAIRKESALRHGIRPVNYGSPELYDRLPEEEQPFYQNSGAFDNQWEGEQEWRHVGDVNLSDFDKEDIRVIVPTLKDVTGYDPIAPFQVEPLSR